MAKTTRLECLIEKILTMLIKKGELKFISNYLLKNHDTYEEIPLFSKHKDIMTFLKYVDKDELSVLLINLAIFVVNNIYLINDSNLFIAITFCNIEEDINEFEYILPNIFISNNDCINFLTTDKKIDINTHPLLKNYFYRFLYTDCYQFYKTITEDKYGNVERIYMVKCN